MPQRHKLGLALGVLALLALLAQQAGRRNRPADEVDRRPMVCLPPDNGMWHNLFSKKFKLQGCGDARVFSAANTR
jgi:hypothetical protein